MVNRKIGKPLFEQPIAAGIFADGTTAGNAALLTWLMDRRNNMLLTVEMPLETLLDAGKPDVPRDQLIKQFRMMADSARRWYLPPEQRVGLGLYRLIIGKLMYLPEEEVGSPFRPNTFVALETARLNRQRVWSHNLARRIGPASEGRSTPRTLLRIKSAALTVSSLPWLGEPRESPFPEVRTRRA